MFYWIMKHLVVGPIVRICFRPWVTGLENIPNSGAAILASNHLSFIDSIILPLLVRRRVVFLAKSEYFTGRGLSGWATRQFFLATGQLPIDRSGGKASEAALNTGLGVLADGKLLGIYPEGTRSPDGILYRGRTGIARMVLEAHVPVVPVAMIDTDKAMPIGTKMPTFRRVGMVIGEPIDFSRFAGLESDRYVLRSVTDEIMYALQALSGQTYRDVYASTVKAARTGPQLAAAEAEHQPNAVATGSR